MCDEVEEEEVTDDDDDEENPGVDGCTTFTNSSRRLMRVWMGI
jgi:hypothetical protein